MKMSLKLRDDVLELLEEYQRMEGAAGRPAADSAVSKECFGYRDFVSKLRKWGPNESRGPTVEHISRFEQWLRERVGEDVYERIRREQAAKVADGF
jgi:hypothetical protein